MGERERWRSGEGGKREREDEGKGGREKERERQNMLIKEVAGEEGVVIRKVSYSLPLKHLRHFTT